MSDSLEYALKKVYRGLVKGLHPDVGGSHAVFLETMAAFDYLQAACTGHPLPSLPITPMPRCLHCSTPLDPRVPNLQYCSDTCRSRAWRARHRAQGPVGSMERQCVICHTSFTAQTVRARYCSNRCSKRAQRQRKARTSTETARVFQAP